MHGIREAVACGLWLFACAGCFGDKGAVLSTGGQLAVGSYSGFEASDNCAAGKLNLCGSEDVQRIDSIVADDPRVLEIVTPADIPAALRELDHLTDPLMLHALAPGTTTVCANAHFSDGTNRKACSPVQVLAVERVHVGFRCDNRRTEAKAPLVFGGSTLIMDVQLLAGDSPLGGSLAHPIDDVMLDAITSRNYHWTSSQPGDSFEVRSDLDPTLNIRIESYAREAVSEIDATQNNVLPRVFVPGKLYLIDEIERIDGEAVCTSVATSTRTETPGICTGPNGELEWRGAVFVPVAEGTCRLSLGVAGVQATLATIEFPFYIVNPDDQVRDGTLGEQCPVERARACSQGRGEMLVCKKTDFPRWMLDSSCGGKLCDYTAPASECDASGCLACR